VKLEEGNGGGVVSNEVPFVLMSCFETTLQASARVTFAVGSSLKWSMKVDRSKSLKRSPSVLVSRASAIFAACEGRRVSFCISLASSG
jgi:hypothetical protein